MTFESKQGFTLVEAIGALSVVLAALALAMSGFMYVLKITNESDVQSELDIDVQLAMERLKVDLRLSSLDEIFYYPAGPGPYTAISFPMVEDSNDDGLFELDENGAIIWDKTVVYHIWPSSPHQLRITTFSDRNNSLSDSQRQEQLNAVVEAGNGLSTYNGNNSSYRVLFENLLDWTIRPSQSIFDAYSTTTERESTSLGFVLLSGGTHTFEFKVSGKNKKSSGYRIGLDQLVVSHSCGAREAEAQLPVTDQSGAIAVPQYMAGGSWKGNHQLYFPSTAEGQSFTLSMNNDRWEETNFRSTGSIASNAVAVFDDGLSPNDFIVRIEGMEKTWEAAQQTGDEIGSVPDSGMRNWTIRILQKGSELIEGGNWLKYNGRRCQATFAASASEQFKVLNAFIGESASEEEVSMDYLDSNQIYPILFSGDNTIKISAGDTATSDWINMPIDKTKNYLVSFQVANDEGLDSPKQWNESIAVQDGTTMIVENSSSSIASDMSWNGRTNITPILTNVVFGLESITASYAESGTFTSQIFDTRLDTPTYGDISWNADVPIGNGASLMVKVRSGDQPDLSDAREWRDLFASSVSPHLISASYKRYVQFQVEMTSSTDGLFTPKLKDLAIEWRGEMQMVNIGATFTKGPEYGIVEVLVDGTPLQSALSVDLLIYKDVYGLNSETKRITSSLVSDIRPRNTGK